MDALRILVVDDEPRIVDVLQRVLEDLGHSITGFTHPMEVLSALEAGLRVDLVLTDYTMPGMNGLRLAEMIRHRWPAIGVGLITSVWHVTETVPFRVFDLVLPKPLDISRLHAELRRFARTHRPTT